MGDTTSKGSWGRRGGDVGVLRGVSGEVVSEGDAQLSGGTKRGEDKMAESLLVERPRSSQLPSAAVSPVCPLSVGEERGLSLARRSSG